MSSDNRKTFEDDENEENSGPSIVTALVAAGVAILVGILAFLKFIPDHVLIQLGIDWKEVGNQLEETQENRAPISIEILFWTCATIFEIIFEIVAHILYVARFFYYVLFD